MIDFAEFKKFFLFNLIGSLIIAALVTVITVLVGDLGEVSLKTLATLAMVVIHSLISLSFIWDDARKHTFDRLAFFINVMFLLIVASFLVSILGIWEIIDGDIITKIYMTFFVIAFASLHGDILFKALNKEDYLDMIIYINYFFILVVVAMLQPVIYIEDSTRVLSEMFFRILGATAIIDGTLSVLAIIFYKLHMNKHPVAEDPLQNSFTQETTRKEKNRLSIWVWILIIYLVVQIIFGALRIFL